MVVLVTCFEVMITSPLGLLHGVQTGRKNTEKHCVLSHHVECEFVLYCEKCRLVVRYHGGSHMMEGGISAWDWVERQPPYIQSLAHTQP